MPFSRVPPPETDAQALADIIYLYIYICHMCSKSRKFNIRMSSLARIRWSKRMAEEIRNT
jgi:hypothetical protein